MVVPARIDRLTGRLGEHPPAVLRAVLSWSVQALSEQAMDLFGLLGIAPGVDIGLPAAAHLADQPEVRVRVVLRELESASLMLRAWRACIGCTT